MKKYFKLIIVIIGLTTVFTVISLLVSKVYKENKQEKIKQETEVMNKIDDEYEKFELSITKYNESMEDITNVIAEYVSYYESIYNNYSKMKKTLVTYEELIKSLEKSSTDLRLLCKNPKYRKISVINECNNYNETYEKINNYFVENIKIINNKIDEYNKWLNDDTNTSTINKSKLKKIEKFNYDSYTYIDLNMDGVYTGKTD